MNAVIWSRIKTGSFHLYSDRFGAYNTKSRLLLDFY